MNIPELHPAFTPQEAVVEASRCLFCFDAPCTAACPTHIDVPGFIKRIGSGNLRGAALRILDANILGASCAKACPGEELLTAPRGSRNVQVACIGGGPASLACAAELCRHGASAVILERKELLG